MLLRVAAAFVFIENKLFFYSHSDVNISNITQPIRTEQTNQKALSGILK